MSPSLNDAEVHGQSRTDVSNDALLTVNMSSSTVDNVTMWINVSASTAVPPVGCLVIPFSLYAPWNNPEDLISKQTQQQFNTFVNVYMLTILAFICVPTNVICMVVFFKHGVKERINLCLFYLALADLVTVLGHFEWNLDGLWSALSGTPYRLLVMKHNVNNMVHSLAAFIYVSGFMTTLVAFERCFCILSPLKAQLLFHTRTTALVILTGTALIYGGHWLLATRWEVVCMYDPLIQQTTDAFYSSAFYLQHAHLVDVFDGLLFGLLLPSLFVATIFVSTIITVTRLRKMAEWREKTSSVKTVTSGGGTAGSGSSASKDVTLTRMLIGTSVLFIVCTFPPLMLHATLPFMPQLSLSGKFYNTYYLLINLQQLLIYINASVNFFVYYLFGTKFRHTVQGMFCRARLQSRLKAKKIATGGSTVNRSLFTAVSSISQTFHGITPVRHDTQ